MKIKEEQKIIDEAVRQWFELILAHISHKQELNKQKSKNIKKKE